MLLEVKGLCQRHSDSEILKDIHLEVEKGELFVIIGLTGSGKTTLLRLIGLLDKPVSGKIYFGGLEGLNSLRGVGSRAFRWPPHLELMRRLGTGARGVRAAAASPEEACREIRRLIRDD